MVILGIANGLKQFMVRNKKFYTLAGLKKKWMRDSKFCQAYEELEPGYQIARAVIAARHQRGMTQAELAEKAGTKQSAIARLENMQSPPSSSNMGRIADALGLRWDFKLVSKSR